MARRFGFTVALIVATPAGAADMPSLDAMPGYPFVDELASAATIDFLTRRLKP